MIQRLIVVSLAIFLLTPMAQARTVAPKRATAAVPEAAPSENLESQAVKELMLPPEDLTTGVLPTPATVRSRIEEVKNPIRPLAYRFGVSLQPYEPAGSFQIASLAPYNLSAAGTQPMVAIEGQWLPVSFKNIDGFLAGGFASLGYAQNKLDLRSPTGAALDNTKLQTIKAQAGLTASYQLPSSPLWSFHGNLGAGRLTVIQSSSEAFANLSSSLWFASLGVSVERSLLPNLSVFVGYDYRTPISRSPEGLDVPRHNVLLGFLGNFE